MQQTDIRTKKEKTKIDNIKTERKKNKEVTEKRKTDYQITVIERKKEGRINTKMMIERSQRNGNMMIGNGIQVWQNIKKDH